jgi:hypothetical protein
MTTMAASNEYIEWHLTPTGWKAGDERDDFEGITTREASTDRVLTIRYSSYMASPHTPLENRLTQTWNCGEQTTIDELLAKFGPSPAGMPD